MKKFEKKIYALDLGTTKFCIGTIQYVSNLPRVVNVSIPAQGMHKGMLVNIDEAKTALNKLINLAESEFQDDISEVVVGIAGSHLQSATTTTSEKLGNGGCVTSRTLKKLSNSAYNQTTSTSREPLHTIPTSYTIDNREPVQEPIGLTGQIIKGNFLSIDANRFYLRDVVKLCNSCGLTISRMIAEPLASAAVVASDNDTRIGVAVADIGGGTTDGIILKNGHPVKVFTINVGGKLMTSDLSIGLSLPLAEAEKAKVILGLSDSEKEDTQPLEAQNTQGNKVKISADHTKVILGPRLRELGDLIADEISSSNQAVATGIILTGGGAEVKGLCNYLSKNLPYPIRKSLPQLDNNKLIETKTPTNHSGQQILPTKFATLVGLLCLENQNQEKANTQDNNLSFTTFFQKVLRWVKTEF